MQATMMRRPGFFFARKVLANALMTGLDCIATQVGHYKDARKSALPTFDMRGCGLSEVPD